MMSLIITHSLEWTGICIILSHPKIIHLDQEYPVHISNYIHDLCLQSLINQKPYYTTIATNILVVSG